MIREYGNTSMTKSKMTRKLLGLSLVAAFTTACTPLQLAPSPMYAGEQLSSDKVAVLEFNPEAGWGKGTGINLRKVDGQDVPFLRTQVEVLPGEHSLTYECDLSKNSVDGRHGGRTESKFVVEAGVHYRLVGSVQGLPREKWYYVEDELMGMKKQELQTHSCTMRLVQHKSYGAN